MRLQRLPIRINPLPRIWQQGWLLFVVSIAASAVCLADIAVWPAAVALSVLIMLSIKEWRGISRCPNRLTRHPDGTWEGCFAAKAHKTSEKYHLERHFRAGDRSLTMLLRDSRNRPVRIWAHRSTCPDDDWRRLLVLLRWPPPDSS